MLRVACANDSDVRVSFQCPIYVGILLTLCAHSFVQSSRDVPIWSKIWQIFSNLNHLLVSYEKRLMTHTKRKAKFTLTNAFLNILQNLAYQQSAQRLLCKMHLKIACFMSVLVHELNTRLRNVTHTSTEVVHELTTRLRNVTLTSTVVMVIPIPLRLTRSLLAVCQFYALNYGPISYQTSPTASYSFHSPYPPA